MQYKIGSFNMHRFGKSATKDFRKIAEIIEREELDIVALQEIFSEGQGVKRMLEQWIGEDFYDTDWDYCFGSPKESSDVDKMKEMIEDSSRGEGYVYLWNKRKFKLVEYCKLGEMRTFEPRIVSKNDVGIDCSFYARAPYYIRLQPLYGGNFEIRLINIHIFYGKTGNLSSISKRRIEYEMLAKVIYPEVCNQRYGQFRQAYTIAMGDYNMNIYNPLVQTRYKDCYLNKVYDVGSGENDYHIVTVQDEISTMKQSDDGLGNNFDHFTYSLDTSPFVNVSYKTIDAVNDYCGGDNDYYLKNISDHLPIVMTVDI